jgi:glycosyltransferase involved in cell wall biosynthesis
MTTEPAAPFFSVVIPAYNREAVLPRAIRSVLGQSFGDLELIIADDGSTDGTRQTVAAFAEPRLRYVWQPNGGATRARNFGASVARGEFLIFLDSDDEALPGWLQRYAEAFLAGSDIVCCGCLIVDPGSAQAARVILPRDMGAVLGHRHGQYRLGGSFALRRWIFEAVGGYADACRAYQHTELSYRLVPAALEHGWRMSNILEPLVRYFRGSDGSIRANPRAVLEGTEYLLERHADLIRRDRRLHANYCAVAGVAAARLGRHRDARRYMWQSLRIHPRRVKAWLRIGVALTSPLCSWAWRAKTAGRPIQGT